MVTIDARKGGKVRYYVERHFLFLYVERHEFHYFVEFHIYVCTTATWL